MKRNKILTVAIATMMFTAVPSFAETYNDVAPSFYFTQGQNFYKGGQYTSAIKSFRKALRENPLDSSSEIGIINSYISRAKYYNDSVNMPQKAIADLKSALFYFVCFDETSRSKYSEAYTAAITSLNTLENSLKADITANGFVKSAKNLRVQGEFAAAGYDFYRAKGDPKNAVVANIGLGDVMKILGKPNDSVKYYETAMNLAPDNPELRLKIARAYEESGQYALAAEHYNYALQNSNEKEEILNSLEKICRQRVEQNPSDAEAHCNLGVIYQKRGYYDNALVEYAKADKLNPALLTSKVNASVLYYDQKKYKESVESANKALLIDPKNIKARLQKAKCFQALSMWENATEEYKNVLKYDKSNSEAQFGLADIYSKNMPAEDAISTIQSEGIELSPEFYAQAAYTAHKNKNIDKAIKFYKLAINSNSDDVSLYLNLGQIYNGQEKYPEALAIVESAKQKFPNDTQVQQLYNSIKSRYTGSIYDSASELASKGDYAGAIAKYQQIIPQGYDSYVGIASVYQMQKNYPQALEYYKKALEKKPTDEAVLITAAGICIQQDNLKEAQEFLNKVPNKNSAKFKEMQNYISAQNTDAEFNRAIEKYEAQDYKTAEVILTGLINKKVGGYMPHYYRAMVYDALGNYQKAVADYEAVVAKDSSIALVYYSLGVDYDSLGNFARAVQNYKKFLELSKGVDDYTKYARQRIQQSK